MVDALADHIGDISIWGWAVVRSSSQITLLEMLDRKMSLKTGWLSQQNHQGLQNGNWIREDKSDDKQLRWIQAWYQRSEVDTRVNGTRLEKSEEFWIPRIIGLDKSGYQAGFALPIAIVAICAEK